SGPGGALSSASPAGAIRPSSVDDALRSLSVNVREVGFDDDADSLAFLAASASDCAPTDPVTHVMASSANRLADRNIREVILFWNIGTSANSAECSNCSRLPGHSHRNTLAERAVHTPKVTASTTRSPRCAVQGSLVQAPRRNETAAASGSTRATLCTWAGNTSMGKKRPDSASIG